MPIKWIEFTFKISTPEVDGDAGGRGKGEEDRQGVGLGEKKPEKFFIQ